jgi:methyl-accepting chemotaxis protein
MNGASAPSMDATGTTAEDFHSSPPRSMPSPPTVNGHGSYLDPYEGRGLSPPRGMSPTRMTSGKSGRVIEKLMAENDRLRRELKVETTAREEERKAKEAIRQARDSLQSTNDNLILQNNIDKSSLSRKDRKIEELKADRDFERSQKLELDERSRIQIKESDEQVQELKNLLSKEVSERKRAVNQYDVVRESFKRMDDGYRQRVERLQAQLDSFRTERERDHHFLQRLEVTVEQQRQELEKLRLAKNRITEKCENVIGQAETQMKEIREMAEGQERILGETVEDAKSTLGALRHVMGVHTAFNGDAREE